MPFTRLHYHLTWTTTAREPRLTDELEYPLQLALLRQAGELHADIHAVGIVADHVHVVISLPPRVSVAEAVKSFKRASAQAINRRLGPDGTLTWQTGYGAVTLDERSLSHVIAYVQNQKEHPRHAKLFALFEQTSDDTALPER